MSADFLPFLPSLRNRLAASPSGGFAPTVSASTAPACSSSVAQTTPVRVEVKRSGDRVTQIQVYCRCGELIEIDCEY